MPLVVSKNVIPEITTEIAPVSEIEIFKVYQTREEFSKDYDTSSYTEKDWFDPALPEKSWIDPTAKEELEKGKLYTGFTYTIIDTDTLKQTTMALPAFLAGRINIPPKKAANETLPGMGSVPTPVRKLTDNEILERPSPFSIVVVNTKIRAERLKRADLFMNSDRELLKEILAKLTDLHKKAFPEEYL